MPGKFEVYEDPAGKWRFRLRGERGEIVASGHGYGSLAAAFKGCRQVPVEAKGAPIVEVES